MSDKALYTFAGGAGSTAGAYIPTFFGSGQLSGWSILGTLAGGILAIYLMYKWLN